MGKRSAVPILIDGLKRESYRGYDSSGVLVFNGENFNCIKAVGKLENLETKLNGHFLDGTFGIAHCRWATHGGVTEENAHPHCDCKKNIWLVHNGIIENYRELKEKLEIEGHKFSSQTDTEVLAHLIEKYFNGNLEEATRKALKQVRGAYALAIASKDDPRKLVVARLSSPLLIGMTDTEYLVASDPVAIAPYVKKVITLEDNEIATITQDNFFILKERQPQLLEVDAEDAQKGGFPHFMIKEIFEQPQAIENSIKGRLILDEGLAKLGGLDEVQQKLREIERINIVACGTAYHAGMVGEYMLEEYAGIPVEVDLASEFRYRKPILDKKSALFCISQSGETADTLAAMREAKMKGIPAFGIVNAVGSTMSRETDAGIYNHIGPEIAVASTKAFVSQLTILALLTITLGRQREMSMVMGKKIGQALQELPSLIKEILLQSEEIKKLAEKYSKFEDFIYLGRKYNYPIALEGALKLKEIANSIHAEGYAGGEMKHGTLALADEDFPFFFIAPQDSVYDKMVSNIEEVKARKAPIIAVTTVGNERMKEIANDVIYIPKTIEMLSPILNVIPLQLFAYHMSVLKGLDPDRPRNLAKSVTVE